MSLSGFVDIQISSEKLVQDESKSVFFPNPEEIQFNPQIRLRFKIKPLEKRFF
jgi:hypothetical protein